MTNYRQLVDSVNVQKLAVYSNKFTLVAISVNLLEIDELQIVCHLHILMFQLEALVCPATLPSHINIRLSCTNVNFQQ
jgi:hypothetical protein